MSAEARRLIRTGAVKKGDPLQTARLAGIMAAKQTAALIPLCHPLMLSTVDVELTPTVIGYHDSGGTDVGSVLCICNTHDAFEAELFAPFLSDTLGIFPVHRLVEHRAKIIADGYRDIRTLLHIVFQLGQRKLLVREVVDRPSRVYGEAEETLKSQARRRSA